MINSLYLQLLVGTLIGLGSGYIGSFMVLRRMSLVGDALSHVALPGIAVALLIGINPFIGAFAALVVAILGIWALEKKTELPSETLVGIFFTLSLALGLLLTPEPELLEALFGNISKINIIDAAITGIFTVIIFMAIRRLAKGLMLSIVSKDLAKSVRIPVDKMNLIFLLLVAVVVALGLKVAGTLLMGSLVIIPAAASKNISVSLSRYTATAAVFGGLSAFSGIWVANYFNIVPGPIVVLAGGIVFLITLLFKK